MMKYIKRFLGKGIKDSNSASSSSPNQPEQPGPSNLPETRSEQTINARDIKDTIIIQNIEPQIPPEFTEMLNEKLRNLEALAISQKLTLQEMSQATKKEETPNELYGRLMSNTLEEIKILIDKGQLSNAQQLISEIIQTEGFHQIKEEHIIKIYYYQGIIYLNKNSVDFCCDMIDRIFEVKKNNYHGLNLMYKLSVQTSNQGLYQQAIKGLSEIPIDETELKLKKLYYEITKGNFSIVINELTELDELKETYKENADALYYLGISYFQIGEFILANKYFGKSCELEPSLYKTYLLTLTEVLPIINRRGAMYVITELQKETLNQKLKALIDIKGYFEERYIHLQGEFWGYTLNIKLFIKPSEIITDVESMPEDLKKSDIIQLMLAEAYSIIGPAEKAEELYRKLYEKRKNSGLLIKITTRLLEKKDYSGVLQLVSGISSSEYDELGDVAGSYIISFSKLNSLSSTLELIQKLEQQFPDAPLLYQCIAEILVENNEIRLASEYMDRAISLVGEDNEALRLFVSRSCENIGLIEHAIKVLLPLEESTKAKEIILRLCLQFDDDDKMLKIAERMVQELIARGVVNLNIYNAQAEIAFRRENSEEALKPLIDSFKLSPSINAAYNIVAVKLNINQLEGIQKYIDFLLRSNNSKAIMLAASAFDYLGRRPIAEEIAYKSLQLLGNEFDETVYLQYSMFYMASRNIPDDESIKINFEKIRTDSVVELVDSSGEKRYICIESNSDLVGEEGIVYLNVEHYSTDSGISFKLLNVELNTEVELDGIEYFVTEVINKYIYAFRYVSSTYIEKCPDSPYLRAIEIREDDPISPLLPWLNKDRKHREFLLEQYNFENSIGLPVSALCSNDYFRYPSAMIQLLETKEQIYYAGEVTGLQDDGPLVLSFSSIVLLSILRCTDIIKNNKDRLKVTKSLVEKVKILFDQAITSHSRVTGLMGLDKSGRPIFTNVSERDRERTVEFWRGIYLTIQELEVIEEVESYTLDVKVEEMIGSFEIDSITAANQVKGVFICDDLFLRKFANFMYDSLSTANVVALLSHFLETEQLFEKIYTLTQFKYHQSVTQGILMRIIDECLISKPTIYGQGTDLDKFVEVIRNILSHPQTYRDSMLILREVIYILYDKRLNPKAEEILNYIVREIVIASRHFKINRDLLLKLFTLPAGIDLIKMEYIKSTFRRY